MQVRNPLRLPRRSPIIAALATLASCGAYADEPSPWYVGASETIRHDSNVNRYSDGVSDPLGRGKGDTYSSTGLLGGFDQSYGRQHFYATGNVAYNKYHSYGNLDNTSYGLVGGWDWSSVYNLSGGVNASVNQSLAQLNGNSGPVTSGERSLLRTEQIGTNVNWGGVGALSVQGAYTHSRVTYTAPSTNGSDSSGDTASLGTYYRVGPTLTTGIAYRVTRTTNGGLSPIRMASAGQRQHQQRSQHRPVGRLALLEPDRRQRPHQFHPPIQCGRRHPGLSRVSPARSGGTYAPTGKLSFNASYARDAGTNGTFFNVPITTGTGSTGSTSPTGTTGSTGSTGSSTPTYASALVQNSTVANTFSVGRRTTAATAKIGVNANYSYRNARISNTGTDNYDDKLQTGTLGVSWAIARAWTLGCNYSHEKRDAESIPVYKYSANVIGCSAQVTLR